jgi:hypothetical protein
MAWGESASERAARRYGENQQQKNRDINDRDDKLHARETEKTYERRNWQNKQAAFGAEQRLAYSEGRQPRYSSPYEVPDIPRAVAEPASESMWSTWFVIGVGAIIVLGVLLDFIGGLLGGVIAAVFQIISVVFSVIFWTLLIGIAALTAFWLFKRHQAGDDEEKIKAARMWNPWNIARASSGMAIDAIKERRARK